jgi:hypothetical protein
MITQLEQSTQHHDKLGAPLSSDALASELAQFYGTSGYYQHWLRGGLLYTDGVAHFVQRIGGYWFIDIVAFQLFAIQKNKPFLSVVMSVDAGRAVINVTDGNYKQVKKIDVDVTDCPPGEWKFYLTDNVLLLTSEY